MTKGSPPLVMTKGSLPLSIRTQQESWKSHSSSARTPDVKDSVKNDLIILDIRGTWFAAMHVER